MVVCFYTRKLFLLKIFFIENLYIDCLDEVSALRSVVPESQHTGK